MQLVLPGEEGVVDQDNGRVAAKAKAKGKRPELRRTSLPSSYALANQLVDGLAGDASDISNSEAPSDNTDIETEAEADWIDEQHLTEFAQKQPSKFEAAMKLERAFWKGTRPTPDCSLVTHAGMRELPHEDDTLQEYDADIMPDITLMETPPPQWPAITDLCTVPGTNRVTLSVQPPLLRLVIQDSFEHVRASLLFQHAFPEPTATIAVLKDALLSATNSHRLKASPIHNRLLVDDTYVVQMSRLLRARVPLFRSEVKERCSMLVASHFAAIGDAPQIVQLVKRQIAMYNYIYPNRGGPPMRSRPYHNERIITVIRELYFSGGSTSFASRFHRIFPVFTGSDANPRHEVPIPMVALVATALYAAILEWHTGEKKVTEFSTTSYLDVYEGHVNSFLRIQNEHNSAFHSMMADIFAQASSQPSMEATGGTMVTQLNLADLDG
ncbi:hypothetical protein BC826DRAFT_1190840 [Russula brevipes]|nr:hypothetical protein BC826DRAFT_1190840 [Russula brevipes]